MFDKSTFHFEPVFPSSFSTLKVHIHGAVPIYILIIACQLINYV